MVELGIMPDPEAYKAEYDNYIRNGLMVQFTRVELGRPNTEAHMQNRKLIAEWCFEKGAADKVIQRKKRDGKTYFVINDYEKLRALFAQLLGEIQRIKSEGDYEAGKQLIDLFLQMLDAFPKLGVLPFQLFARSPVLALRAERQQGHEAQGHRCSYPFFVHDS